MQASLRGGGARPSARLVPRSGLLARFENVARGSIVTLVAAGGYGKSTLLDTWACAASGTPVIVTLEPFHDSVQQLGRHLVERLAEHLPTVAPMLRDVRSAEPDWPRVLMPRLLAALDGLDLVLLLDDVQVIEDSAAVELLDSLANHLPSSMVLVLAGRRLPPVRIARRNLQGRVVSITEADLELQRDELETLRSPQLSSTELDRIYELTGGWPAGVRLALLARDATGVSGNGSQSQWLMSTYLDQEVLGSMPGPLVAFLEDVAVLGSADVGTLDIARDANDSATYLAQLETNPAPMVRITDGRRIAVQALLTGHLRRRLRTRNPARVTTLLDRAATSLGARHRDAEAFELLVRLGDHARLADFCYRRGAALAMAGRTWTVRRWLSHFTPADVGAYPEIPMLHAIVSCAEGDYAAVVRWLEIQSETARVSGREPRDAAHVRPAEVITEVSGIKPIGAATLEAMTTLGWTVLAQLVGGVHAMGEGDLVRAEGMLKALSTYSSSYPLVEVLRKAVLAFILSSTGRVTQGRELLAEGEQLWDRAGLRSNRVTFLYDAALARFAAHSGDRTRTSEGFWTARNKLTDVPEGLPVMRLAAHVLLVETALWLGDAASAATLAREAVPILAKAPQAGYLRARLEALSTANPEIKDRPGEDALTTAELRVLRYLASYYPVPRIAAELYVSPATVRSHAQAVYRKLGVHTRAEAVDAARSAGLID